MGDSSLQLERRAAQRFDFQQRLWVRQLTSGRQELGFTQNLSARGLFLYTDFPLESGTAVEVTLSMPAEITLSESMHVRCRGRVLRVQEPVCGSKFGVAVHLESYEYLNQDTERQLVAISSERDTPLTPNPLT
ncbi:MAG TPA: PilZ domain-containing protein [Terriglobales bacterium]|nr:PilZ domain-containing protein [Terriglobales bacterium]